MADAKIKDEHKETVVGFANSGLPLGERPQQHINQLAIMAQESKNPGLIELFEDLPSVDELKQQIVDAELAVGPVKKKEVNEQRVNTQE